MVEIIPQGEQHVELSILMPTHNRADVIGYAIQSVLAQSFTNFELLIVGDGCTDDTAEVVQSFDDVRIIWMDLPKAPNYGYANRNIALKQARGKYIGFMAHDDLILPDHFERCIRALEDHPELELVYTRPGWVTSDGLLIAVEFNLLNASTRIPFLQRRHNALPASCVVHRTSCFEKYGYWNADLPFSGDLDMWARIISGTDPRNYTCLPEVTCLHFVAIWKTDPNSGQREVRHWRALYETTPDLPAILSRDIPLGIAEQQILWEEISNDPNAWSSRLREAISQVFDLRIETLVVENSALHNATIQTQKLHDSRLEQFSQREKEIHALQDELKTKEDEIAALRNSYSWRIGRSVTKVIDVLFGWLRGVK